MTAPKRGIKSAEIVTIGNELTTGMVADTNSRFIATYLLNRGYAVARIVSVPDNRAAIIGELRGALRRAALVVVTGGLGPTHDDITKEALCGLFKCKTRFNPTVLRQVQRHFKKAGKPMPESNRSYADIPTAAEPVENRVGTAPGLFFGKKILAMPGVPLEAQRMLLTAGPRLIPHGGAHLCETTLHTARIGEVGLSGKMRGLEKAVALADVAFLPAHGRVDVRIIARAANPEKARQKLKAAEKLIRKDIEPHIWGTDGDSIETVVSRLLAKHALTLCVAESCTGGAIGKKITAVPGSSGYFMGGIIAYSNAAKEKLIGVPKKTLARHGAVSAETAAAMAKGARKRFGVDFAISATGIAGPGGGTPQKPVGLTFIGLSTPAGEIVRRLDLPADRATNREWAAFEALHFLYENLRPKTIPDNG